MMAAAAPCPARASEVLCVMCRRGERAGGSPVMLHLVEQQDPGKNMGKESVTSSRSKE
jgi:hypothetical protein